MPELPEVETVRAGLEHGIINKTIARVVLHRADLRLPFPAGFAQHLEGSTITSVRRRAKYLLIHLSGGVVWLAHLGMSGRFSLLRAAPDMFKRHEHVAVIFTDGAALIYNDPRRFGVMDVVAADAISTHKLLAHLGFEPLAKDFPTAAFAAKLKARGTSIKQALMDASLVVGVGNIYASEALFTAGIDPRTPAAKAARKTKMLMGAVQDVLRRAIAAGGSSLRDFHEINGGMGYFQHRFAVYGREGKPCLRCAAPIRRIIQGGRSTYFCPSCQR